MGSLSRRTLTEHLNKHLNADAIPDYCVNGLQVEGKNQIEKVATAVTASEETIEAAIQWGADALIVHHGIFWKQDSHEITGSRKRKLKLLFDNNINLLAYHLPLDVHETLGNNWKAARDLGLSQLLPFCVEGKIAYGVKGKIETTSRKDFQQKLETYYAHPAHTAFGRNDSITNVALISGGAYKYIREAVHEEMDAFITGNFDEPAWHIAKEENINFFAMGHSATEVVGPKAVGEYLKEAFELNCKFLDLPNPF